MQETTDQVLQFLRQGIAWVLGIIQFVWTWSSDQISRLTQSPWENWPLWKQFLFLVLAALVAYPLYIAARRLWRAVLYLLYAIASFISALIVTLPPILIAGAIALAGLWVINSLQELPALRSFTPEHAFFMTGACAPDLCRAEPSGGIRLNRPGSARP